MANLTSSASAAHVAALLSSADIDDIQTIADRYRDDPRIQVQKARAVALRRLERERLERERVRAMYEMQTRLGGRGVVIGVDEVGRGSVAGPLTVCAVCLPPTPIIWGVNDSKRLSAAKRQKLAARIERIARAIGICHIPACDIDRCGMGAALRHAVRLAVADCGLEPDCVLMDGNPLGAVERERCVVHGDALVASIAAASIVAKVTRDDLMIELDSTYPGYHLAASKGYASPEHIEAIRERGLTPEHRASFCGNFVQTLPLF
ncbi:RNase HII [Coriobacterium glomerans PW2]|uniref:Ribonuclease HII n=1 Tax=Coriobacterium glomerans (strain ATCC 49209 / DSM 20642 / JCM 10262 / PW2) TaxID=700015 RepID=F2N9G2_CORGP|nr:ribonuclease HII [Coriobacterium glomerans]AEB06991.1 RNase HII [Coriobacterium glomerans PW2]